MSSLNQRLGYGSVESDFGFLDNPQKYAEPRIQIQGAKDQPNTAKKYTFLLSKPKSELLKKNQNCFFF